MYQEKFNLSTKIIDKIKTETRFDYFHKKKTREFYTKIQSYSLVTIKSTIIASKRIFSAAGLFCTKMRLILRDQSIDILYILRVYFLKV